MHDPKDAGSDELELEPDPAWLDHIDGASDDAEAREESRTRPRLRVAAVVRERPDICIGPDIDRMTDEAVAALARDGETYQRGGALVHVAHVESETRGARLPLGAPMIRPMPVATLRERLAKHARWIRQDGRSGQWRDARPDDAAVQATHARPSWPGVRVLVGVSETPIMRPDGAIVQGAGYDEATGYVYAPSTRYPAIPASPSHDDARDALAQLVDVFRDFPFASPAARFVPVAAILTILARTMIDGSIPVFVFDASTAGSGKTLLADATAITATGRDAARTTYPAELEELRKVLDGFALDGARLVVLDNVPTSLPLGGAALDAFTTARDTVSIRELGRTGNRTLPWRAAIVATGNNVSYLGDTVRRVLVARLEPDVERPETRTGFAHADLIAHVRASRPRLVAAALTLIRAFVVAGRPNAGTATWGSFTEWSALVPPAIVWAGGVDPMGARLAGDGEHDPEASAIATILDHLPRLDADGRGIAARDIVGLLYPGGRPPPVDGPPDGFDELRAAIEYLAPTRPGQAPSTSTLGHRLRASKGRVIAGRRLVPAPGRSGVARWRVDVIAK